MSSLSVTFIINGEEQVVEVQDSQPLKAAIAKALAASDNSSRPAKEWEARTDSGTKLDTDKKIGALGILDGGTIYLSLGVGAGG